MAHCVISLVVDTDQQPPRARPGCIPHVHWAPCPLDGQPASTTPLHTDDADLAAAVQNWRLRTHSQRPLVIHHGSWAAEDRDHDIAEPWRGCWCGAQRREPEG